MSDAFEADVMIEAEGWAEALHDAEAFAARVLACAAKDAGVSGTVAVVLADDARVRALNARFRAKDAPTNVLSFPAGEGAEPGALGDVILAFETVAAEARAQGKPFEAHAAHLLAHGLLHLVGFDHETDDEAERMEARERAILADLGYPDPYAFEDA